MTTYAKHRISELLNTYDVLHASRLEQEEIVNRKFWNEEDYTDDEAVLKICEKFEEAALTDAVRAIHMYSKIDSMQSTEGVQPIGKIAARRMITDHREDLQKILEE